MIARPPGAPIESVRSIDAAPRKERWGSTRSRSRTRTPAAVRLSGGTAPESSIHRSESNAARATGAVVVADRGELDLHRDRLRRPAVDPRRPDLARPPEEVDSRGPRLASGLRPASATLGSGSVVPRPEESPNAAL
jgi:hypothetical protein